MEKIVKNIPNVVTISRVISCLLGAIYFISGNIPVSILCYIYGAVSDACDGFLARKLNAVTSFGKKLDPISDKIYALSLIIPSIVLGNYLMLITLFLEAIISGINVYSDFKYKKTHTEKIGKIKTIFLFPTMILGLISIKIPTFYIAFIPSLYISSKLQAKSILAYSKQLNDIEDTLKQEIIINKETMDINNKVSNNNLELTNENRINYDNNVHKKLVKRKCKNDRY